MGILTIYPSIVINYYDVDDAVTYLTEHAEKKSVGQCAQYVRMAIKNGGCLTFLHPTSACDYIRFLPKLNFKEVAINDYHPQKGDIIVFQSIRNHEHGHIAMYNGNIWISDFKQRDMFGGKSFREQKIEYHVFRRNTGLGIRKIW